MKKRIFVALMILIAFLSISVISASEINVNDTYTGQDSSSELLTVDNDLIGSNSSNILSTNNVDANLDKNIIGASNESSTKKAVYIEAPDINLYYKNGTKFVATLFDVDNNKLANQNLIIGISGVNYTRVTDANGQASIAINLIPGDYDLNVYYNGNNDYLSTETSASCSVYPTIFGNDMVKYYKNGTQYYATFLDNKGSPLANTDVTFNINGVFYTRTTNASGVAKLNINLPPNRYILTAIHPGTGYMHTNIVDVLYTIHADNLTKIFRDSHQYYATFLNGDGTPLTNADVTFNIHGVFYTRTTNSEGTAKLNINLEPGQYILTAYHPVDESRLSNLITVYGSSTTKLNVNNYVYAKNDEQIINVTLLNQLGYGIDSEVVVVNVDGKSYSLETGSNGTATVMVDLNAGLYTVDYSYSGSTKYSSSKATSTIVINDGEMASFYVNNTVIYYNNSESFNVDVLDVNNSAVVGETVSFTINGATYKRTTNANGTAKLNINLNTGIYDISYKLVSDVYQEITGSSKIAVIDGNTSILSGSNTTIAKDSGETFKVTLSVGDVGLPDRKVIININGINYTRTTDNEGVAEIAINLNVGQYPVKYYYLGEDRIKASQGEAVITVKEKIPTSLTWQSATSFISDNDIIFKTLLVDKDNNPLANKDVVYTINAKTYLVTTDSKGVASLTTKLSSGSYLVSYKFDGDQDYISTEGSQQISVSKSQSSNGFGYWSFGGDMYNIDLSELSRLGTTDILLNFYAFTAHGESAVLSWISKANSYGINVHIWMQVFYSGGSWVNPVSGGSPNQAFFNEVIEEAKYYAGLPGVAGVHFDYLRYPGTAYKTSGGTAAITEFVKQATTACREVNPNIIMSAAVMPETTGDIYYYGQDIPAITKYLDVIVPMQYKGNYKSGTSWLASTTKWFVQNSNGAEVWSGLQSYVSDDNVAKLTYTELFNDAQTVIDSGADGVILFRFGLSVFLNFNDLDNPSYGDTVEVNDIVDAASRLKSVIESNWTLPTKIAVGTNSFTIPQFLYLMSEASLILNGDKEGDVLAILVDGPESNSGNVIHSELDKNAYLAISKVISDYCSKNNQAPNNVTSLIGDIKYESLVYMYSRILDYADNQLELPAMVLVNDFLDNPTLTVNMIPSYSTTEYKYINYTTTWLNYCPNCGYYGTFLINPKGTYEGELTCYHCDCDYCGVTGHEKIMGSDLELTRLSQSVPTDANDSDDDISIASIVIGATYIADYYKENETFPDYVLVTEGKYTVQQFLYLMSRSIVQISSSNFSDISLFDFTGPQTPSGDAVNGSLSKSEYIDVANRVSNFIINNNLIPNYASSNLGKIAYSSLVDTFSRVLQYYGYNDELPSSIHVEYITPSSKSISDLSKSLIAGLTSVRAQATALYNYVRDYISYEFYYNTVKGAEGTLVSGGGNCCDQAQLLVAMARSVGLTVRFDTGYCTFSSGSYGHVWVQFLVDGSWINADPTSTRNSFGVINNWNTATYTDRGTYDILPY